MKSSGESELRVLDVDNLVTHFETARGLVKAVNGVSLSVPRGRTLGIVGESGSGKTILSRSIMGLLPPRNVIRRGRVSLAGKDLTALRERELQDVWGSEIAMVFQNPMTSLNPVRTVGAQVAAPLRHHQRLGKREARQRAAELLRSVGIPEAGPAAGRLSSPAVRWDAPACGDRDRPIVWTGTPIS